MEIFIKLKIKRQLDIFVKNQKGLSIILSLINGKLISHYKYEQLLLITTAGVAAAVYSSSSSSSNHKYSEYFNIKILPPLKNLSLNNY